MYFFYVIGYSLKMVKKSDVLEYIRKHPDTLKDEFIIKKNVKTIRKTFEVDEILVEEFMIIARGRKLKIKNAIDQALRDWISKK